MANTRSRKAPGAPSGLRIAIVGGGCAGMAAAWELSKAAPGRVRHEVHVYERNACLGGKGASIRDAKGRIMEHGLHVWLGFYENAFRMIRECYAEVADRGWGPAAAPGDRLPHGSFEEAFFPEPHIGVAVPAPEGAWEIWSGFMPPMKGLPGDPIDAETNPFTLANYLLRCLELGKTLMLSMVEPLESRDPGKPLGDARSALDESAKLDFSYDPTQSPQALIERMARMLRAGLLTSAAGVLQGLTILEEWIRSLNFAPQASGTALQFVEALTSQTRKQLRDLVAIDPHLRWKTEIIDIVMTITVGLYRDKVLFGDQGLDALNGIDYRKWLLKHGATRTSVESPFLTGIYDFAFAYRDGDRKRPSLAAGVALRSALRMFFTYRGSLFWRMRSGMGDAVFAPLYKVLADGRAREKGRLPARGKVQFHFGHALEEIEFQRDAEDRLRLRALSFRKSDAESLGPPLDDFGCWRARDAATEATEVITLRADKDFDAVIFALGVDDLNALCKEDGPLKSIPEWDRMFKRVQTTATKVAQVWFGTSATAMGWHTAPGLVTALGPPFDTWANMTHTIASERAWRAAHGKPESDGGQSVAYLCGTLSKATVERVKKRYDGIDDPAQREARVREGLQQLIQGELRQALPDLPSDEFKARLLATLEAWTNNNNDADFKVLESWDARARLVSELSAALANAFGQSSVQSVSALVSQLVDESLQSVAPSGAPRNGGWTAPQLAEALAAELARLIDPVAPTRKSALRSLLHGPTVNGTFVQPNHAGSERYTPALAGSIRHRISPLERWVDNMTIAGDWTACGLDSGCVEAAVMSGLLAAVAVTGEETAIKSIVGYHHP